MKIKVKDAAKELGMHEQSLRLWLRQGNCPFGFAYKGSGKAYGYYINPERFKAWISAEDLRRKGNDKEEKTH